MTPDPRLFMDIETSRSVRSGELSSNWIVSACAVLAGVRELCNRVSQRIYFCLFVKYEGSV